jgi:hypothetical protein
MRKSLTSFVAATAICAFVSFTNTGHAAAITLGAENAERVEDLTNNGDGTGDRAQYDVLDLGQYSNAERTFPVFVFQLNSGLAAVGQQVNVSGANFSVTETLPSGTPPVGDLYGIRISSSDTILASDYQNGTLLQSAYSPATGGSLTTTVAGSAALTAYLQANYVEGDYVFIGLKTDPINFPNQNATDVGRFGNSAGGQPFNGSQTDATLTFTATAVPEPASLVALAGLGGMGLLGFALRRRRRNG